MNQTFSFVGGSGVNLGVLAAGLILAFGVWRGRRDLGTRAALEVMAATLVTGLLPLLLALLPNLPRSGSGLGSALPWTFLMGGALGLALGLVPLWVAVDWMEQIRDATRPGAAPLTPRSEPKQSRWVQVLLFGALFVAGVALLYATQR